MKTAAQLIRSKGELIIFCSKQALFLVFQMAQHIAAKPAIWVLRLTGANLGNHQKNWEKLPGRVGELTVVATAVQTNLAAEQPKKR
jgi:hypothetical protein